MIDHYIGEFVVDVFDYLSSCTYVFLLIIAITSMVRHGSSICMCVLFVVTPGCLRPIEPMLIASGDSDRFLFRLPGRVCTPVTHVLVRHCMRAFVPADRVARRRDGEMYICTRSIIFENALTRNTSRDTTRRA